MAIIIPHMNHVSVNCICHRYNIVNVPKASSNNKKERRNYQILLRLWNQSSLK